MMSLADVCMTDMKERMQVEVGEGDVYCVLQVSLDDTVSPPSSSMAVKHGPCLLTLKKGSRLLKASAREKFSISSYLEHKTND